MLGIFEAEAVRHLGDGFSRRQPVFGKLDDEPADVVACRRVPVGASEIAAVVIDIPYFQYPAHLVPC